MSIRKKMAIGAGWQFLEKGGRQLASILVFAFVARIIGPEEYGLVSLCYIFMAFGSSVIEGLTDPIVSMQIKDDNRLSTVFWSVLLIGLGVGLFTFLMSSLFAQLLDAPKLEPLLQIFAIVPVVMALASVPTGIVMATMDFRIYTLRTFIATIIGGGVGVYLAVKGAGAFALVWQQIVYYLVTNVVLWIGAKWMPKLYYDIKQLKEIIRLGLGQSGSLFVVLFEQQTPRLLLGMWLGPVAVGHWAFISRLRFALQDCLLQPMITVIYPAFASIQKDKVEQSNIFSQVLWFYGILCLPAVTLAIVLADQYVPIFFGESWVETVPLLQFFLVSTIVVSLNTIQRDLMRANKKILVFFRARLVTAFCWVAICIFLIPHGLIVFLVGEFFLNTINFIVFSILVVRTVGINVIVQLKVLWPSLLSSGIIYLLLLYTKNTVEMDVYSYLWLFLCVCLGGGAYSIFMLIFDRQRVFKALSFFMKKRNVRA